MSGSRSNVAASISTPVESSRPVAGHLTMTTIVSIIIKELAPVRDRLALLIDFGLDETGEVLQRILPAEIARFLRNDVRNTFLHDVHLGANGYLPERHRHLDFARQIGIVEFVRVAQALAGHELQIFSAERMAHTRVEISK